ncbi:hypothetical protein BGX30_002042 [Mortierella sp. GBA39]|nr:hypothetical protein BGX30_002042 [Mortierella sp. GBA39]
MLRKSALWIAALQLVALVAYAHVDLITPCPRYSSAPGCPPPPPGQSIDYNTNAPISSNGVNIQPLCKHSVPYAKRTVYKAGESISTGYGIDSSHGGGHCQWALSYDREKTWVVIQTEIRTCLQGTVAGQNVKIPVTIPTDAPSGEATFMWAWINAVGAREFYSNCADIQVDGMDGGSISGVELLLSNYNTTYGLIPEFPNPTDPDSHELFDARKPITISVKGSGSGTTSTPDPSPSSKPNKNAAGRGRRRLQSTLLFISTFFVFIPLYM